MNDRFYITGGTLPPDADSYVTRRADEELLECLRRAEFCYVLNTRQVGKSSLMVRVAQGLRAEGVRVVLLDPTAIGVNVSVEEWYDGLLTMLAEQLGLRAQLEDFWLEHPRLGPLQRWMQALEHVALPHAPEPLCVFVDEIDSVRSLPFSADEFFGGIRECYNRRAQNPLFRRLTFCLLGVAAPVDLIADARITPFNIGRRIELTDFTPEEAAPLGEGLNHGGHGEHGGGKGKAEDEQEGKRKEGGELASLSSFVFPPSFDPPLDRILYWTGGHPYLTQRLCSALAQGKGRLTHAGVDAACEELFLSRQAQKTDDNLAFVRSYLLYREADRAALLDIYRQILSGQKIREDATNPLHSVLRLAGIVKVTDGTLTVRNRIYAQVFNRQWVRDNMPGEELRRQKAAYRRGLWRAVGVSSGVMAALTALTLVALQQTRVARQKTDVANRKSEEASRSAQSARDSLALANRRKRDLDAALTAANKSAAANATLAAARAKAIQDLEQEKQIADVSARRAKNSAHAALLAENHAMGLQQNATERLSRSYVNTGMGLLDQGDAGSALASLTAAMKLDQNDAERMRMHRLRFASACALAPRLEHVWFAGKPLRWGAVSPDRRWAAAGGEDGRAHIWNLQTGAELPLGIRHDGAIVYAAFSPDGTRLVTCGNDYRARVWDLGRRRLLCTLQHPRREDRRSEVVHASWSRDGKRIATGSWSLFSVWDVSAAGTSKAVQTEKDGQRADEGAKIAAIIPQPGAGPNEADISPDGKSIASLSGNFLGWVLGVDKDETRFIIASKELGGCYIGWHGAFSADGRKLAVAGMFAPQKLSPGVAIFDALSNVGDNYGTLLCPFLPHRSDARYVSFSPDDKRVVTASDDRTARVWDADTGKPLTPPMLHDGSVTRAEFSPDGSRILTASDDRTARVWNAVTGEPLCAPLRHAGAVVAAHFGANPNQVFTVSRDGTARVWTLPPTVLPFKQIASVACGAHLFAGVGKLMVPATLVVPGSPDVNRVRIVNAADGKHPYPTDDTDPMFTTASWSADERRIAFCSGSSDTGPAGGKSQVWDVAQGRPITPVFPSGQALLSPDGRGLLLRDKDNQTRLVDVNTGQTAWQCVNTIPVGTLPGFSLFAPDGRRVVVSDAQNRLRLLDARTGRPISPPMLHDAPVTQVRFAPGGRYLFTWATSETTRIWNVADGSPAYPPLPHQNSFKEGQSLAFTADGRWAVSATTYWKLDGSPRLVARELRAPFNGWSGSPDGSLIALQDKEDWLWDIETRASRTPALDRDVKLRRAAFSPDSRTALAIRADGAARLWDIRAGQALSGLLTDDQPIISADFSPDGKQIATGGDNGSVRLWDARTGEALGPRLRMSGTVSQTEFLPGGRLFVCSNREGRLWSLPNETESMAQMEARALLLSGQRIDANIGALPADTAALRAAWQRLSSRQYLTPGALR